MYIKRMLAAFALLFSASVANAEEARPFNCLTSKEGCVITIIIPHMQMGQVYYFEICKGTPNPEYPDPVHPGHYLPTCDWQDRDKPGVWESHSIPPPDGVLCTYAGSIEMALAHIEQHRRGWLWAGSGCFSRPRANM